MNLSSAEVLEIISTLSTRSYPIIQCVSEEHLYSLSPIFLSGSLGGYKEDDPINPLTAYARSKAAVERDLLALEMEDHYLRIHTVLGSDLILLRLRDALAELGSERGRQVHRSWWVAEGAVATIERSAGRLMLKLRNGVDVPVSKTFRDQVKAAGWLD